jgi:hypothetical protein
MKYQGTAVIVMVTAMTEGFTSQEAFQRVETQDQLMSSRPNEESARAAGRQMMSGAAPADEIGNPVVVSKDFILNLLSLAIGGRFQLEGNLGKSVDVKV